MFTLKDLRKLLILSLIALIATILSYSLFDPSLGIPALDEANKIALENAKSFGPWSLVFGFTEISLLIYSLIALWLGRKSGKWTFYVYIFTTLIDGYFNQIIPMSWLTMLLSSLYFLITGMIVMILVSSHSDTLFQNK